MTGEDSLYNVAEIAIALAGFSGLVAVFRSERLGAWLPRERFLFWLLISFALAALFFALLPVTLHLLGFSEAVVWATASALLASYYVVVGVAALIGHVRMNRAGHPTSRPLSWYVIFPTGVLVVASLLLNAFGIVLDRAVGVYHLGLLYVLACGSTMFVFLLVFPTGGRRP